jgi:hypothetical protein
MTYEKSIEVDMILFKEYSEGIAKEDINWIKERIISLHPDWKNFEDKNKYEFYVLDELNSFLFAIKEDKPSDIKAYVEKKLKKQEYDKKIKSLMSRAGSLHLGDEEKCDQIEQELKNLLTEADNEFPDFSEEYGRFASEIRMDLMAVRTGGKRGSSRMIMKLLGQRMEKEMNEKTEK